MPRNVDHYTLRDARKKRGLTQDKAAQLVGVSRSLWSFWENKERSLSVAYLNKIQTAIKLSDKEIEKVRKWWDDACL